MKWRKSIVVAVIVIQFFVSVTAEAERLYSARSHCSITGATGNGYAPAIGEAVSSAHRCSGFFYTSPSNNNLFMRINDVSRFL